MAASSRPKPVLVGIAGGSGAGKSWLAEALQAFLGARATRISLDDFFRDRSHLPPARRAQLNFDNPAAIDWTSVERTLRRLAAGRKATVPCYDFSTHCRLEAVRAVNPARFVIVDGLWIIRRRSLRRLFELVIYVDCAEAIRFRRRLTRDLAVRGRTRASVKRQIRSTVKPMHDRFVAPQARIADVVISGLCGRKEVEQLARRVAALGGRDIGKECPAARQGLG